MHLGVQARILKHSEDPSHVAQPIHCRIAHKQGAADAKGSQHLR